MTSENQSVDQQLQPHLAAVNNEDVTVKIDDVPTNRTADAHPNWERFDDEGDAGYSSSFQQANGSSSADGHQHRAVSGSEPHANGKSSATTGPATAAPQPPTVLYNSQSGEAVMVTSGVTSPASSGTVIATQRIPERWREMERPLRARQMKILKVLSVVSAILFFPSGIPAVYFAWRTKTEFDEGILRGNIDRAQKFARRTQTLIILSAILAVMVAVLAFALVERANSDSGMDHSYVAHGSVYGRTL